MRSLTFPFHFSISSFFYFPSHCYFLFHLISLINEMSNRFTYQWISSPALMLLLARFDWGFRNGSRVGGQRSRVEVWNFSYWLHGQTLFGHISSYCCAHFALHLAPLFTFLNSRKIRKIFKCRFRFNSFFLTYKRGLRGFRCHFICKFVKDLTCFYWFSFMYA